MGLSPGDRIDRYEVLELLGAGGMGEVYRARDPKLARLVALKILHVGSGAGTDGPARLLREARAAAALTHANVLAIYDVGEVHEPEALRGLPYIAMELVVGKTLRAYVGDDSVPIEKKIEWLREVAKALGAAHAAGLVHRDVKPENVMIREDGAVKVLDFGIARRSAALVQGSETSPHAATLSASLPTLTGPGQIVGTPFFMAPEQLRGEELDGRADQFAWGVMAYLLLTGVAPWKGKASDPIAIVSQILSSDPPIVSEVAPKVPTALARAIGRAFAKRPEGRFPSMAALLASFDGTSGAAATTADPPRVATEQLDAAPRESRWPRPSRGGFALASSLLALAVAVTGAGIWRARSPKPNAHEDSGVATAAPSCSSNLQCVEEHGGQPWHCHSQRHVCVELASQDCKVYAEPHDAEADDVVWFGGSFPLSNMPSLDSEMRAANLAREDFAHALGPSAGRRGPLHARPIGLVICDEGKHAARAMGHLVEDVQTPAILGFFSGADAARTIPTIVLPAHALAFITINQGATLTTIPQAPDEPRLVWRSTLNHADYDAGLAAFVSKVLEPAAHAGRSPYARRVAAGDFKVASVLLPVIADATGSFFKQLEFNGKSALANGSLFRQFVYDRDGGREGTDLISSLLEFAPDVIHYGGYDFAERVILPLEAARGDVPAPVYLTSSGMDDQRLRRFIGRNASRRHRFFGILNTSNTMPNAQLVLRYNLAFPSDPVLRNEAPQPSYDAFYTLAYAALSLGEGAVTGASLSNAFDRTLPPGRPVDVGPAGIFEAFSELRTGRNIDLNGAIGSLDYDRATGEAPIDYAITCFGLEQDGLAGEETDSGLFYRSKPGVLSGTLACP